MLDFYVARDLILQQVPMISRLGIKWLPLEQAYGRILAIDQIAIVNLPPMDNSAMDGYACSFSDLNITGNSPLPVSQRIAAGDAPTNHYPATLARIFTGASLPYGADTVIIQENCTIESDEKVKINRFPVFAGENVRKTGEEIAAGKVILTAGQALNSVNVAIAAAAGLAQLPVWEKLRVGLLLTGNELVEPGNPLPPGGIYNSNRYSIKGILTRLGCEVSDLGVVNDTFAETRIALKEAAKNHHVIITTGGVSVGDEDHVKAAVEAEGHLNLWRIAMKPGKPLAFGEIERVDGNNAFFVGLPGNPVSAVITFLMLVRPFILRLQGESQEKVQPLIFRLPSAQDLPADERLEFIRVSVIDGYLHPFIKQQSSMLSSLSLSDGLAIKPANIAIKNGDMLEFISYRELGL